MEAFQDYRTALPAKQDAEKATADAYASLFNPSFFQGETAPKDQGQAKPITKDQVSDAIIKQEHAIIDHLPSLVTLRAALACRGADQNNVVKQAELTKTVLPTIAHLDTLRSDLNNLDRALKDIDVRDPKMMKTALDLTIKARRHLAALPADASAGFTSTEDSLYRSRAMRLAIERAILVRLKRFSDSAKSYQDLATAVAQDHTRLSELPEAEKHYQAFVELTSIFSQLFKNLHKYDAIQATEKPEGNDVFKKLAEMLPAPAKSGKAAPGPGEPREAAPAPTGNGKPAPAAAITLAPASQQYLQLLAEIYLDLFDLEHELGRSNLVTATYARMPRKVVPPIVQLPQQSGGQDSPGAKSLPEQLLAETPLLAQVVPFDLKPFTAEEKASFDLIVGFSRAMKITDDPDDPPVLKLFDKAGADANEKGAPFLQVDPAKTTNRMLVFRLPYPNRDAGRIASGSYYPKLFLKAKHLPDRGGQVDYTFSVASANPKVVLGATLRQIAIRSNDGDEENDDEVAARGIIPRSKSVAVIEAMVTAGSPVQNVDVTGFYQKIEVNGGTVSSPALIFLDDGVWPDTTQGNGVYTTKITLDPQETRKQADYRVLIEAKSTDKTSYVPTETFKKPDTPTDSGATTASKKAKAPAPPVDEQKPPAVPKFQRATSVNFLVEGASGTS